MAIPALLLSLVSRFAEKGLSTVGNAILAKGKEAVEEKLGVKIPDDPEHLTPELISTLRIKAIEHEEFLVNAQLEDKRIDLRAYEIQIDDTKNARQRETDMLKAGYVNSRGNYLVAGTAVTIVLILFVMVLFSDLNDFQKSGLSLILGRALGYIDQVFNFEFGTTRASKQKDDVITKLSNK